MTEHAQLTIREIHGPYMQLLTNLQGENGREWLTALKKFLRKEDPWSDDKLSMHVRRMEFTGRTCNVLTNAGILTVGDLIQRSSMDLIREPNFGRKCLNEVEEKLDKLGLSLKP